MPKMPDSPAEIPWILIIVGALLAGSLLAPLYQTQVREACNQCEAERVRMYPACLLFRYPFTRRMVSLDNFAARAYAGSRGECSHRYVEISRVSGMAWQTLSPAADAARDQWIAAYQMASAAMPGGDFERLSAMVFHEEPVQRRVARDALRELTTEDLHFRLERGLPLTDRR